MDLHFNLWIAIGLNSSPRGIRDGCAALTQASKKSLKRYDPDRQNYAALAGGSASTE
jgi:hypothetical protein